MPQTKIRRIILAAAIMLTLALAFAAAMTAASRAQPAQAASVEPEYMYIMSEFGGYVAVFEYGQALPSFITDTRIDSLPPADRQLLADGIKVYSGAELAALLEDYGT